MSQHVFPHCFFFSSSSSSSIPTVPEKNNKGLFFLFFSAHRQHCVVLFLYAFVFVGDDNSILCTLSSCRARTCRCNLRRCPTRLHGVFLLFLAISVMRRERTDTQSSSSFDMQSHAIPVEINQKVREKGESSGRILSFVSVLFVRRRCLSTSVCEHGTLRSVLHHFSLISWGNIEVDGSHLRFIDMRS